MNFEYQIIFISILLSSLISIILFSIINFLIPSELEIEKMSAYECGFHPFEDTRQKFNVRFYLVSLLFLVFDLEIIFIFPFILSYNYINLDIFFVLLLFLIVLTIGFIYEWIKGALTWE